MIHVLNLNGGVARDPFDIVYLQPQQISNDIYY